MGDQTTPAGGADTKRCPICAERVKAAALICRFCGHDFRADAAAVAPAAGDAGAAPWQTPAPAPGETPAPGRTPAPGQIPTATPPRAAEWGQWGASPGVQTAGPLPAPSSVPGSGYPGAVPHARTNGYAVASMVLGILWLWCIGSALALIFGYVAKNQIDRSNGMETGRGMAIAGIILGWVGVGLLVIGIIAVVATRSGRGY